MYEYYILIQNKRPHGRNSFAVLLSIKENKESEQVTENQPRYLYNTFEGRSRYRLGQTYTQTDGQTDDKNIACTYVCYDVLPVYKV